MEATEKQTSLLLKTISNKKETNKPSSQFRPFLSYKNFKKISQEKLDSFEGEENILNENINLTSTYSITQLFKSIGGGHSLCRILKQFSDGRIWIEIGGHELLLMQTVNVNTEMLEGEKEIPLHSPSIGNVSSSTSPHSPHSHLTNCIFANNKSYPSMIRPSSLGGYPERMPFSSFIRSFICLLKNKEFIEKNFEEKEENINNNNSITDRENVRRILKRAGIAEHRYRLGLSQILLQRELLEELENKRSVVLLPVLIVYQANCRKYLISKRMEKEREKDEAIRIIQWNLERWQDLNKSKWWKLFVYIRPLIPAASVDAREHRLKEHLAQLELELDELRSEHSRAQLELESAQKSKQIAEKWSEEIGQINKKLMGELKEAEEN
uniref:Uncharacterized protein n=2 Tax=Meloidogyne incognita TaxID=6306 RepID=A0A914LYS3_MELIC